MAMYRGRAMFVGDMVALLRSTIASYSERGPRGGVRPDKLHPFPEEAVKRRRAAVLEQDGWAAFDAVMTQLAAQSRR